MFLHVSFNHFNTQLLCCKHSLPPFYARQQHLTMLLRLSICLLANPLTTGIPNEGHMYPHWKICNLQGALGLTEKQLQRKNCDRQCLAELYSCSFFTVWSFGFPYLDIRCQSTFPCYCQCFFLPMLPMFFLSCK